MMRLTRHSLLISAAGAVATPAVIHAQAPLVVKMAHIYTLGNIWFETASA